MGFISKDPNSSKVGCSYWSDVTLDLARFIGGIL